MAGAEQPPERSELLTVDQRLVGQALVVSVAGEIDMLTAPRLRAAVDEATGGAPAGCRLVLDLSGVLFLGSAGLSLLADLAAERGSAFHVVAGSSHSVRRAIQVAALDGQLPVHDSLDQALAGA